MTTYANPGAVANVPPSPNKIESTWGNAIRDRVVNNFDTTAHRDAAIPSPVVGQACYCADIDSFLVYAGATSGWCAPWNTAWGVIDYVAITANSAGFTTVVDLQVSGGGAALTSTKTYIANRRIKITGVGIFSSTVATDQIDMQITDATPTVVGQANGGNASGVATDSSTIIATAIITSVAGSKLYKLRALRGGSGTATLTATSTAPAFLLIEDIGPSGAPS